MKKKIILYGASNYLEDIYFGMRPCFHILGLSDKNTKKGKKSAEKFNIDYIEPEKIKQIDFDYICIAAKYAYGNIFRDLVYKYDIQRSKIFHYEDFYREIELSLGELNQMKTIYVIRCAFGQMGFFAVLMLLLPQLVDLPDSYEVYFDFLNYRNIYMKEGERGQVNSFEKWFQQPCGLTAEEVYNSKHVVLAPVGERLWLDRIEQLKDTVQIEKYVNAARKYICPNEEFERILKTERERVFSDSEKVCAVIFRGTDYLIAKTYGHPIHPDIDTMIDKVKVLREQWGFRKIYLSTEDAEGQKRFVEEFGEDLVFSERRLISNYPVSAGCASFETALVNIRFERENDEYLKGMEYLRQIFIASECDYIISGVNASYRGALLLSGGFEKCYEFDLGVYGIDDDSYITPWGHYVLLEEEKKVEKQRIEEYEARCREYSYDAEG